MIHLRKITQRAAAALILASATALASAAAPSQREGMGPILHDGGVAFRVWAPNADAVSVVGPWNGWNPSADPLALDGGDAETWSADIDGIGPGNRYKYHITWQGQELWRKDPRSLQVENSSTQAASIIPDLEFQWPVDYQAPPRNEIVLYEMHIGTFNDAPGGSPGTLQSAIDRLDHLQELGINMIALMPINEFGADFSWGYNPAFPFSVESAYGDPRDLKEFVAEANRRGIGVMGDVVHNHWGPSDLAVWQFDGPGLGEAPHNGGIYFYNDWRAETPWGNTRPNYGRPEVRDFISDSATLFLDEYRFSGLRWDSTGNIYATEFGWGPELDDGRTMLQEINDRIDSEFPNTLNVAEDFARGDWITRDTGSGGLGFDSQWAGAFVHPMRDAMVAAEDSGRDMWSVRDAISQSYNGAPLNRVIYTESHDEVANGRSRVPEEIWPENSDSYFSRKRSTLGAAILMTSPGMPMLFQGQEILEDGFFSDTDPVDWARKSRYNRVFQLYKDLVHLRRDAAGRTAGLQGTNLNIFHVNDGAKVIAYHRWDQGGPGDDVVVVANFSNTEFPVYNIGFPRAGEWYSVFNSDSTKYGADYTDVGAQSLEADGAAMDGLNQSGTVSLGPYSAYIYTQKQASPTGGNQLIIY